MRVKETVLRPGLSRLDYEPMSSRERNIPVSVIDEIMMDIIDRKERGEARCCNDWDDLPTYEPTREKKTNCCCCNKETRKTPNSEPDGIDVHCDRPLIENYDSYCDYREDLKKYRELERAAKACDWPCKEPMRGLENAKWVSDCTHDEEIKPKKTRCTCTVFEFDFPIWCL